MIKLCSILFISHYNDHLHYFKSMTNLVYLPYLYLYGIENCAIRKFAATLKDGGKSKQK